MVGATVIAAAVTGVAGILMKSNILILLAIAIFALPLLLIVSIPTPLWVAAIFLGLFMITRKK